VGIFLWGEGGNGGIDTATRGTIILLSTFKLYARGNLTAFVEYTRPYCPFLENSDPRAAVLSEYCFGMLFEGLAVHSDMFFMLILF
jgi:hypothetical protein